MEFGHFPRRVNTKGIIYTNFSQGIVGKTERTEGDITNGPFWSTTTQTTRALLETGNVPILFLRVNSYAYLYYNLQRPCID